MPTKIREIIIEVKNPEFGFTINLSLDLVQKKALLISNESVDNFVLFPARQITRMDLQKQAAAIDTITGLMDLYFGKELSIDFFNGNALVPKYDKTVPSVPMIDKKTTVITQPAIDSNPTNEPVKNSEGTYTNTCNYCGKPFQTKRPKAFMCGSKECTTAYNREYMKKRREAKSATIV
jgi:hypothetical protein